MLAEEDFSRQEEIRRNSKEGVNRIRVLGLSWLDDAQSSSPTNLYAECGIT